jgi:hypothetical protein
MHCCKVATIVTVFSTRLLLGADFFPLQEGNKWTYREAVTGETFSIRVGQAVPAGGHTYYKVTGYAESDLLVRVNVEDTYRSLVRWDQTRNLEVLLTSFEPFEGGYWLAPARPCPEQAGQTQVQPGVHDGPAGPIADVLEVRYIGPGCADVGPLREQYAEHLGMLRRTQNSIAGPRTFDLVSAQVGNLSIDAAPVSRFSLSVTPPLGSGPASATFRLQVQSSPLTLSFPSGQEFEFVLKDGAGNLLWTWSSNKTFLQAFHQRTVADEWSESVDIPWPAAADGGPQSGDYTVQAYVTAIGVTPFAATLPVTIAPRQ